MNPKTQIILRELRLQLEQTYGERLAQVILFGSQARKDAVETSDIDVMVVLKGYVSPGKEILDTGEIAAALSLKYDVVVSCIFVSEERFKNEQSPLLLNVRKEGVAA
ncbi:MAG: nucleotidyltransferase domain-containing protein [Candidatus Lindowbacteria bacterium]|nr:nucleotidyltransferase domain-containing protein [Candidatus Lindowbacteria bacterium]